MSRLPVVAAAFFAVTVIQLLRADAPTALPTNTLKGAYAKNFEIGAAIPSPDTLNPQEVRLLATHFSSVTPENIMKPEAIQPVEGRFVFEASDRFVADASKLGLQIHGHTLVWHSQCPAWFFREGDQDASSDLVLRRMREHIAKLVGRYKGRIARWDVVNEAIDDGEYFLRKSKWFKATGEEFIVEAFKAARRADPKALLYYNDYSIDSGAKREKAIRLIKLLKNRGAPIDGVGIQGHWTLDSVPYDEIEKAICDFAAEGLRVAITELDIDVVPRGSGAADVSAREKAAADPYPDGLPSDRLQRQTDQYARLYTLFRKHADKIDLVTVWGLHDGRSWLNYWPRARTNHPLFWNRALEPKPALQAVIDAARP